MKQEGIIATGIIAFVMASLGTPMFSNKKNWFFAASILSACLLPIGWIFRQYNEGYFSRSIHFSESITLAKVQHILILMSILHLSPRFLTSKMVISCVESIGR